MSTELHSHADAPLAIIGHISIPTSVLNHRFVQEALQQLDVVKDAEDERDRVIGTTSKPGSVQLYGWARNIAPHRDRTGIVYGVCLNPGLTVLKATDVRTPSPGPVYEVDLHAGSVFRLDDHLSHWTDDSGARIAVFCGPFPAADDAGALKRLTAGIKRLASGKYRHAPRISSGYIDLAADEAWATVDFEEREIMLLSEAKTRRAFILSCALCEKPASRIDHYWPFHSEQNRCLACAKL